VALTAEQRAAFWDNGGPWRGHRVVSARPGAGKTTAVTEYCIDLVRDWGSQYAPWQGMAVVSYTNVAKDELEHKVRGRDANTLLASPHFVGTIDAFLNQYLFLPFGAKHLGCPGGRPRLVGEPYGAWRVPWPIIDRGALGNAYSPAYFDCYGFGADGQLVQLRQGSMADGRKIHAVSDGNRDRITAMKRYLLSRGYALQTDANYIAYALLADSDSLTRAIINRFPVFVVDEAQDMTEVQHALLDHLQARGQKHILLIGDEYQAIYEWNTARPQLFLDKKRDEDVWHPRTISETFRCSPAISLMLSNMAAGKAKLSPSTTGKNQHYLDPVQIVECDPADDNAIRAAIDDMARLLHDREPHDVGTSVKTIAVLSRGKDDLPRLQGLLTGSLARPSGQIVWGNPLTKDYLRVVNCLLANDFYAAMAAYETLLFNEAGTYASKADLRAALTRRWAGDAGGVADYRIVVFADLQAIRAVLPAQTGPTIADCAPCCSVTLMALPADTLAAIKTDCVRHGAATGHNRPLASIFAAKDERTYITHPTYDSVRLLFSTIHGVKGETHDGVLLFTRATAKSCTCSAPASGWKKVLQHDLVSCENKRLAYVALSRAAQLLTVLAPKSTAAAWTALI
jgi:superfamily I DNA/RNA helicase